LDLEIEQLRSALGSLRFRNPRFLISSYTEGTPAFPLRPTPRSNPGKSINMINNPDIKVEVIYYAGHLVLEPPGFKPDKDNFKLNLRFYRPISSALKSDKSDNFITIYV